jgi:hypothetical protein
MTEAMREASLMAAMLRVANGDPALEKAVVSDPLRPSFLAVYRALRARWVLALTSLLDDPGANHASVPTALPILKGDKPDQPGAADTKAVAGDGDTGGIGRLLRGNAARDSRRSAGINRSGDLQAFRPLRTGTLQTRILAPAGTPRNRPVLHVLHGRGESQRQRRTTAPLRAVRRAQPLRETVEPTRGKLGLQPVVERTPRCAWYLRPRRQHL